MLKQLFIFLKHKLKLMLLLNRFCVIVMTLNFYSILTNLRIYKSVYFLLLLCGENVPSV